MKIAVLWSSPNTDGLTAAAKNKFIAGAIKSGSEIEEIHLNKLNINHCMACGDGLGACYSQGKCVLKDDFAQIYAKLAEADAIVIITAVYWFDLTECMKAFIDRLRRCDAFYNHLLENKKCFLVACAGGSGNGPIQCLNKMEETLKHMKMVAYDRIPVVRFNKDYVLPMLEYAGETFAHRLETDFYAGY